MNQRKKQMLDLAVIEGRWWKKGNSSVRGLFDVLADITVDHPAGYHYEMFNNSASLKEIVQRTAKRYRNIYIAAHGGDKSISGAEGDEKISRAKLRNMLSATVELKNPSLRGMFFGSCNFIDDDNAKFLLKKNTSVRWVAGYSEEIDFIDSSMVDIFFWNSYYRHQQTGGVSGIVKMVAKEMKKFMPGAYNDLKFNIFLRGKHEVRPLLPTQDDQ